jgi:hypothetical protein
MSQTKAQLIDNLVQPITGAAGSASAPTFSFTADPNTGIYSPGADQIAVATNGTGRLFVDASGSISTSSTAWQGGSAYQLGGLQIGASTYAKALLQTGGTSRAEWLFDSADNYLLAKSGSFYIFNTTANPITFATNGSERLRITSAGLVGVGTSSPGQLLSLKATGEETQFSLTSDTDQNVAIYLGDTDSVARGFIQYLNSVDALRIASAGSERMRIDSSGRVGIGTSNPGSRLEIGGDPSYDARITFNRVPVHTSNDGVIGELFFQNNADSVALIAVKRESAADDAYIQFATQQTTGGLSEKVRITAAGLVGIGTNSPSGFIHIQGTSTGTETYGRFTTGSLSGDQSLTIKSGASRDHMAIQVSNNAGTEDDLALQPDGGRVGIGTQSPTYSVEVQNTVSSDVLLRIRNVQGNEDTGLIIDGKNAGIQREYRIGVNTFANTPDLTFSGPTGFRWFTAGTEKAQIDTSGRLLVGTSNSNGAFNSAIQIAGNNVAGTQLISRFDNGTGGPVLYFAKSRSATVGTNTIAQNGDEVGVIGFYAADGANYVPAANILVAVDGTPGASDMPGRLVFSTTADGASSSTERMRITNGGDFYFNCTVATKTTEGFRVENGGQPTVSRGTNGTFIQFFHAGNGSQIGNRLQYVF